MCHAFSETGTCANGRIGDGNWDRFAYFKSNSATNYGEVSSLTTANTTAFNQFLTATFGTTTPTRYQVYQYEMAHASTRLQPQSAGSGVNAYADPSDLSAEPVAITPGSTSIDRRVLTAAVINCTAEGVSGRTNDVNVKKWIDLFLVQPSQARALTIGSGANKVTYKLTENSDVYVELIGSTQNATEAGAVQLVKKSVPYLIE
jgi:hypothetical protein